MKHNGHGTDHAKDHVELKPSFRRSQTTHPSHSLLERVRQQQEHQDPADDTQVVTHPGLGSQVVLVSLLPSRHQQGYHGSGEENGGP